MPDKSSRVGSTADKLFRFINKHPTVSLFDQVSNTICFYRKIAKWILDLLDPYDCPYCGADLEFYRNSKHTHAECPSGCMEILVPFQDKKDAMKWLKEKRSL